MLVRRDKSADKRDNRLIAMGWLLPLLPVAFTFRQCIAYFRLRGTIPKNVYLEAIIVCGVAMVAWYYLWHEAVASTLGLRTELKTQKRELMQMQMQRHDLLNELTLALMYLQSGHLEKGQQCLRYAASHVSSRESEESLPEDAWVQMINLKQREAMERGIDFHVHLTYAALGNSVESHLLARLLGNLLDNALDAAVESQKPFVLMACKNTSEYRRLVIGNNGATIPTELMEEIRKPGFSTKGEGRGYGLAISQRLIQEIGGHLRINSDPQTEWTEVSIVIPTAEAAVSETQDETIQQASASLDDSIFAPGVPKGRGR